MRFFVLFAGAALAAAPSTAAVVDPFAAFDLATGALPASDFVFGTYSGGAITPFASLYSACPLDARISCAMGAEPSLGIYKNLTGSYFHQGVSVRVAEDRLLLHPGPTLSSGIGFVASAAGSYRFAGLFSAQDDAPTGVTVGATSLGSDVLAAQIMTGGTRSFDFTVSLAQGQAVNFYVGPAGNYSNDTTGLKFTATAVAAGVPEPATWATMLGGFGLLGGAVRRRRNAAQALSL